MAPNLQHLSFKGINMDSNTFVDCIVYLKHLQIIDISNCRTLEPKAITALVENNKYLTSLKAMSCRKAITDESLALIAKKCRSLRIFDISYCNGFSDEGLLAFGPDQDSRRFVELFLSGITGVSNVGISAFLHTCEKTLHVLNVSLLD